MGGQQEQKGTDQMGKFVFLRRAVLAALLGTASLVTADVAHAYDRTVDLINRTNRDIVHFYASNVGENNWQEDILGEDVLPAHSRTTVDLYDGTGYCRFDFKTVFSNGATIVRSGLNVCEVSTYTLY